MREIPFRMQVYVGLFISGNDKPDVLGGWLDGGIFTSLWPMRRSPNFLSKHKTPTFISENSFTALEVVSSILHAHQARSHFSQSGAIPLTTCHVAKGGVEIPPLTRTNYQRF